MEIQPKNTNNDELNEVLFRFLFANSKFEHVVSDDVIKSLAAAYCNKVDWSAIFRVHPDNRFLLICLFASRVPLPAELRRTVVPFLNARRAELPAVFKRIGQARYAFMLQNLGYDLTKDDTPARRAFWADNYKPKDQLADWLRGRFLLDKTLSSKIRGQKWLLDFCLEFPKFNLLLPGIKEVGEKLQIVPKLSYYGLEDDRYLSWPLVANFKVLPFTDPN